MTVWASSLRQFLRRSSLWRDPGSIWRDTTFDGTASCTIVTSLDLHDACALGSIERRPRRILQGREHLLAAIITKVGCTWGTSPDWAREAHSIAFLSSHCQVIWITSVLLLLLLHLRCILPYLRNSPRLLPRSIRCLPREPLLRLLHHPVILLLLLLLTRCRIPSVLHHQFTGTLRSLYCYLVVYEVVYGLNICQSLNITLDIWRASISCGTAHRAIRLARFLPVCKNQSFGFCIAFLWLAIFWKTMLGRIMNFLS